jgi:hypothetical protein
MHLILGFKFTYLNAWGWSTRSKHVAYIDETNKMCCCWRQHVCQFWYDIQITQREKFHKNRLLKRWGIVVAIRTTSSILNKLDNVRITKLILRVCLSTNHSNDITIWFSNIQSYTGSSFFLTDHTRHGAARRPKTLPTLQCPVTR